MDSGEVLELPITSYNKGGVVVDFGALQGFIPKSHLASIGRAGDDPAVIERLKQMVGDVIGVKVIEVSRRERRLIMSERRASREWRATQKRELLTDLKEGDIRKGRVSSIADFGVFVDLGGADGLVHISEVSHERGKHPRELVKVGQEVDVYVLALDPDRRRIGLSMKRLLADPWSTAEDDHYIGQICDALVTNLTKFGAFAQLPTGLEGLIHVSEISDEHVEHPREAVRPGQKITVEILSIEPERQRIGLSVRRVPEHLRTAHEQEPAPEPPPEVAPPVADVGEVGEVEQAANGSDQPASSTANAPDVEKPVASTDAPEVAPDLDSQSEPDAGDGADESE
jgi:small subunit ribosomal protein S1